MSAKPPDRPSSTTAKANRLIGIDWGTSSFRASRIGAEGQEIETREAPRGLMQVPDGDFAGVLRELIHPWLADNDHTAAETAIVASGMVTARQGWREVPYVNSPASVQDLADAAIAVAAEDGLQVHLVPGMQCLRDDGLPDVMRGEETQIAGLRALDDEHTIILPGTHSKWVTRQGNAITGFRTFMTGEVFATLSEHSILALMMDSAGSDAADPRRRDAFFDGIDVAHSARGHVLSRLFAARTLPLTGHMDECAVADWLSGLLIGGEIGAMLDEAGTRAPDHVTLVGRDDLSERYAVALDRFGVSSHIESAAEVTSRGHWRIARTLSLV